MKNINTDQLSKKLDIKMIKIIKKNVLYHNMYANHGT